MSDTTAESWIDQLDPNDPTVTVHDGAPLRRIFAAAAELKQAVTEARAAGLSWSTIGLGLDVSADTAEQQYG